MKYPRRMHKLIAIAGVAALACSATTPVLAAEKSSFDQITVASTQAFSLGQLVTAQGKPVRAGVPVQIFAWPNSKKLAGLKVGESFKLTELSSVKTDAAGKFNLSPALKAAGKSSEPLSVTVTAQDGSTPYQYSTELAPENSGIARPALLSTAGTATEVSQGRDAFVMKPSKDIATPERVVATRATSAAVPAAYTCNSRLETKYSPTYAQVGASFLYASGASADYQFKVGSSSSLGVATSSSGKSGSFSAGGTASITSNVTLDFPTSTSGIKFYKASVVTGKFSTICQNMAGPGIKQTYQIRPVKFTGGMTVSKGTGFSENHRCVKLLKKAKFTKDKTRAITWSRGMTLPKIAGFNVSSQSGFTSSSKIVYAAGKKDRKICGHTGWPAENAGNIKLK
ncbi:hypothetical protein [Glutamicibacter sp.]|uniref:hypothetical protein n=1 Tax=Glutamicibacter sp. TaxID=1931995 RepID=UPI002B470B9F|nr:hypothetical protein [Glutamicibacter sp.]HJX78116.1 hypothetical protein [Glutamicibacter sp.]